jgi:hypothetical protein
MIKHNAGQTIVVIIDYCITMSTYAGEQRVQVMSGDPRTGYHIIQLLIYPSFLTRGIPSIDTLNYHWYLPLSPYTYDHLSTQLQALFQPGIDHC